MPTIIRVTTVPLSLNVLLRGQMRYMKEHGFDVVMVSADGKELPVVLQNEQCPHVIIPMTRQITPFRDLLALWRLMRLFRKLRPDIVHSHTPKAGLLAMLAARFTRVPVRIHTIAGLRFMTVKGITRKVLVSMEKLTGRAANHVWPNSQSLLQYVKDNKLASEEKLEVIGHGSSNGVDLKRYSVSALQPQKLEEARQLMKYDSNLIYLLSVGRIVKDKGIDELALVFTHLYEKNKLLRLVLAGSLEDHLDPIGEEARKIIKEHPGIIHIPWSEAVEYFMHLATILVHPSHREGFPNVLLQAGAMECPIVCSRIEGNIDIVTDEQTGMIFTVNDIEDLEQKLEKAIKHPELIKKFAIQLRQTIEQYFDQPIVHKALKDRYEELLKHSS
ncbi:MAG: glycosyltransferase family 4 protein, partial [Bacteroidetes bacterium]|nr:glycosyltransferase family 4 protein [Bacteroidota bacterium]